MTRFYYSTSCVASDAKSIHAMQDAARSVSFRTLCRHCVDLHQWAHDMGYAVGAERGLHLKDDFAVGFYKSKYRGKPCYFVKHSHIEYIWLSESSARVVTNMCEVFTE